VTHWRDLRHAVEGIVCDFIVMALLLATLALAHYATTHLEHFSPRFRENFGVAHDWFTIGNYAVFSARTLIRLALLPIRARAGHADT
jgi:hypothetical protein